MGHGTTPMMYYKFRWGYCIEWISPWSVDFFPRLNRRWERKKKDDTYKIHSDAQVSSWLR